MLYLLNSMPQKHTDWQLLESVIGVGDNVVLYESAVKLVSSENAIPILLAWLHQGIRLFVLAEPSCKDFRMSKPLADKVLIVSWEAVVDLVANSEGVCSL